MLDHVALNVADFQRSKLFYERALQPLGISLLLEPMGRAAGFGRDGKPFFWLDDRPPVLHGGLHVAFTADDRQTVEAFHAAALAADAADNGAPGVREIYHPHYYAAFVLDPDGNNIEAVCHKPA